MTQFCLPKADTKKIRDAFRSGELNPSRLQKLDSKGRRDVLEKFVGPENAHHVNAAFESKLLLKEQYKGMIAWAENLKNGGNITPERYTDIIDQINSLGDRILAPKDEKSFLADLAAKKLGVSVSKDQVAKIAQLTDRAKSTRDLASPKATEGLSKEDTLARYREYGNARMALSDYVSELKTGKPTLFDTANDIWNLPRSLETQIGHFSAPGVQLMPMITTPEYWKALPGMIRWFTSEERYNATRAEIVGDPRYETARQAGLVMTDLNHSLTKAEEEYRGNILSNFNKMLAEKTGLPINLVSASSRAFIGMSNYVRFKAFYRMLDGYEIAGEDISPGSETTKNLANVVKVFSGRADLPLGLEHSRGANLAGSFMFFSPRKMWADISRWNPAWWYSLDRPARVEALKLVFGRMVALGGVYGLANSMGYTVGWNPLGGDFGSISFPNGEKLQVGGSDAIVLRLIAQLAFNQRLDKQGTVQDLGNKVGSPTRMDLLLNFLRGKLNSSTSMMTDWMVGKNAVGQDFNAEDEVKEKMLPIVWSSFHDWSANSPHTFGQSMVTLPLMGLGMHLDSPRVSETKGMTVWGEPYDPWNNPGVNPMDREFQRLGAPLHPPTGAIDSIKLTDDQHREYIYLSGQAMKNRIQPLIENPSWQSIPDTRKRIILQEQVNASRQQAQAIMKSAYPEIQQKAIKKAFEKKLGIQ